MVVGTAGRCNARFALLKYPISFLWEMCDLTVFGISVIFCEFSCLNKKCQERTINFWGNNNNSLTLSDIFANKALSLFHSEKAVRSMYVFLIFYIYNARTRYFPYIFKKSSTFRN